MRLLYLPAIMRDTLRTKWGSTPLNWMDPRLKGTAAYHPYALTSYVYWREQPFTWEPDDFIFGDSGGYTVFTRGVEIDSRDVIRWQVKYCNVGVILDSPPGPIISAGGWRDCLARTVASAHAALPLYLRALDAGGRFRWWGVVHGRTAAERDEWFEAIRRVYPFEAEGEGWAFKPHPLNDPVGMAHVLEFIGERSIRRAHFFGTAGRNAIETLCCLGPETGLELAMFDSTTASKNANFRTLIRRGAHGNVYQGGEEGAVRQYMIEQCPCVSCELMRCDLRENGDLIDDAYWRYRITFHNAGVLLNEFATLQARYDIARRATVSATLVQ